MISYIFSTTFINVAPSAFHNSTDTVICVRDLAVSDLVVVLWGLGHLQGRNSGGLLEFLDDVSNSCAEYCHIPGLNRVVRH